MSCPTGNTTQACLENASTGVVWYVDADKHYWPNSGKNSRYERKKLLAKISVTVTKEKAKVAGLVISSHDFRFNLLAVLAREPEDEANAFAAITILGEEERWKHSGVNELTSEWADISEDGMGRIPKQARDEANRLHRLTAGNLRLASQKKAHNARGEEIPAELQIMAKALTKYSSLDDLRSSLTGCFSDIRDQAHWRSYYKDLFPGALRSAIDKLGIGIGFNGCFHRKGSLLRQISDSNYLQYLHDFEPVIYATLDKLFKESGETPTIDQFDEKDALPHLVDSILWAMPDDLMRLAFDESGHSLLAAGGYQEDVSEMQIRRALERGESVDPSLLFQYPDLLVKFGL